MKPELRERFLSLQEDDEDELSALLRERDRELKEAARVKALDRENLITGLVVLVMWATVNILVYVVTGFIYSLDTPGRHALDWRPVWTLVQVGVNILIAGGIYLEGKT